MTTAYHRVAIQVPAELRDELQLLGRSLREWALNHPETAPDYLTHETCSIAQVIEHLLRSWENKKRRRVKAAKTSRAFPRLAVPPSS
jgi:hypothetical protein